jgi:fatty acid desaturase
VDLNSLGHSPRSLHFPDSSLRQTSAIEKNVNDLEQGLRSISWYQAELRKHLPEKIFHRTPTRALLSLICIPLTVSSVYVMVTTELPWYFKLFLGIVIGQAHAAMSFLAHETLHGAIVGNRRLQDLIGFLGFAPYLISPTYWRFWHNNLHHGHTQLLYKDPDAFPTLGVYKRSRFMRAIFPLTPGSGTKLSLLYFFYWFPLQAVINQVSFRFKNKMWEKMDHKQVTIEFAVICFLHLTYIWFIGRHDPIFLILIPFMAQNYTNMSYVMTNHNLSPYTKINDPLVNSLTVTNPKFLEYIHLNFGYHTEHHIFPRLSGRYAKIVHEKMRELYPNELQVMPKWEALKWLYKTPRIYRNSTELVNPLTGSIHPTL